MANINTNYCGIRGPSTMQCWSQLWFALRIWYDRELRVSCRIASYAELVIVGQCACPCPNTALATHIDHFVICIASYIVFASSHRCFILFGRSLSLFCWLLCVTSFARSLKICIATPATHAIHAGRARTAALGYALGFGNARSCGTY